MLYSDYVRDIGPVNQRMESSHEQVGIYITSSNASAITLADGCILLIDQTTILAPSNSAIMRLSRKPHQGLRPASGDKPYHQLSPDSRIAREKSNLSHLARWVSTHLITQSIQLDQLPSSSNPSALKLKNMNGKDLEIVCELGTSDENERWRSCKVQPGNIPIIGYKLVEFIFDFLIFSGIRLIQFLIYVFFLSLCL